MKTNAHKKAAHLWKYSCTNKCLKQKAHFLTKSVLRHWSKQLTCELHKCMSLSLSQQWQQSDHLTRKNTEHDVGDHGGVVSLWNSGKNLEDESVSGHWENNAGHSHSIAQCTATSSFTCHNYSAIANVTILCGTEFKRKKLLVLRMFSFTICGKCYDTSAYRQKIADAQWILGSKHLHPFVTQFWLVTERDLITFKGKKQKKKQKSRNEFNWKNAKYDFNQKHKFRFSLQMNCTWSAPCAAMHADGLSRNHCGWKNTVMTEIKALHVFTCQLRDCA